MSSVKDSIIAKDLIGNQITQIELNDIEANTEVEKSIVGRVRSGDYSYSYTKLAALEENINKYSDLENKIVLTGTFEDSEGHETEIEKEITLAMDWYGITTTTY
jgi:copper homeostasis protein CutC